MAFDIQDHDKHFGVTEDRKKPGGSNAGKYKGQGPFCGPSGGAPQGTYPVNTRERAASAIAYARNAPNPEGIKKCVCRHYPDLPACKESKQAMTEQSVVPKSALMFMDHECFAQVKAEDQQEDKLLMMVYSGGVIKNHFYWGDLAIDLAGMEFPKEKYPILENHDTGKKIGFATGLDIDSGALMVSDATFVDTPESQTFRKLSKQGFPFESSVYSVPTAIRKLGKDESAVVNGMAVEGPATIWERSTFKEASVCVFGYDPNTKSTAFADEDVELTLSVVSNSTGVKDDSVSGKEEQTMDYEKFSAEHPELLAEIVEKTTRELTAKFDAEKRDLEAKLSQERDGFNAERQKFAEKVAALEKAEAIRREKEIALEASGLWKAKLSASNIPDRLFDKVMTQVNYGRFVKDGSLDVAAFSAAIDTEIKDWEDRGVISNVLGFGVSVKAAESAKVTQTRREEQEDDEAVKFMLSLVNDPAANK